MGVVYWCLAGIDVTQDLCVLCDPVTSSNNKYFTTRWHPQQYLYYPQSFLSSALDIALIYFMVVCMTMQKLSSIGHEDLVISLLTLQMFRSLLLKILQLWL